MKKSSLIGHTVEAYDLILRNDRPADSTIDTFFRSHKYLGSHDRRFVAEAVYGLLRNKLRLETVLDAMTGRPPSASAETRSHLLCLLYLIIFGAETPALLAEEIGAENDETLPLLNFFNEAKEVDARQEHGFHSAPEDAHSLSVKFSFPRWMVDSWLVMYGPAGTVQLCESLNSPPPLALRVNTIKTTVEQCQEALAKEGITTNRTKLSPFGLTVAKRMNIFALESFQKGFFEVQDEGSQLLPLLLDPKPRSKVVDACAGAGGKSLAIAALMKNHGVVHALDINAFRLEELRKRIRRSGVDTIRIHHVKEGELPEGLVGTADNVLVDAPCSGLGTIRRNPGMKWTVTPADVQELSVKQSILLDYYAQCVRPLGRLVYATCTMNRAENEEVVERFLSSHQAFEVIEPSVILSRYGLESIAQEKYFRVSPHLHGTDGFFAVAMRRKE